MHSMSRLAAGIAATVLCATAFAGNLPDSIVRDRTVLARRGSLGANSYVVTNVFPELPAYQLSRVAESKLRDRAVNIASAPDASASFALPGRKTVAGYARSFILYLDVTAEGGCKVSFTGADALYTADWFDTDKVTKGKRIFSFLEIADNVYLVETRELTAIRKED